MTIVNKCIIVLSFLSLLVACDRNNNYYKTQGQAQGTYYSIIYKSENKVSYNKEIDSILKYFDKTLSNYDSNSVISHFNNSVDSFKTNDSLLIPFLENHLRYLI